MTLSLKAALKNTFAIILFVFGMVACGGSPESEKKLTGPEEQQQKDKASEDKQKRNARSRKMAIEHHSLQIAALNDSKVVLRGLVRINTLPKSLVYSTSLDKSLEEQFDLQDKTDEIRAQFPNHNLEVSSFKFKSGTAELLALEYRFLRYTNNKSESASQFVLILLDKSLGNKAVIKTQFEFPTQTALETWAKKPNTNERPDKKPDDQTPNDQTPNDQTAETHHEI